PCRPACYPHSALHGQSASLKRPAALLHHPEQCPPAPIPLGYRQPGEHNNNRASAMRTAVQPAAIGVSVAG
ncbi:hypothetical protein, partial [uncultured Pseudomonas sp.]|uniref:hypothetical protein n=1 Tax=uncultured Pseudomonas sp. TaxID=114707 RepID=UPI00258B3806